MISLQPNEKIINSFRVKKSLNGKGTIYITNFGIHFESKKIGALIALSFEDVKSYQAPKKDKFSIVWYNEGRLQYEFKVDSATEVFNAYATANVEYIKMISGVQSDTAKRKQNAGIDSQIIHYRNKYSNGNPLTLTIIQPVKVATIMYEMLVSGRYDGTKYAEEQAVAKVIPRLEKFETQSVQVKTKIDFYLQLETEKAELRRNLIRSRIPKGVKFWNDTWYSDEDKLYIVYNKHFTEQEEYHNTRTQLKWRQKYGDDAIIIPEMSSDKNERAIEFHHGYPAIKSEHESGEPLWFLLPTITDEMITDELLLDRLHMMNNPRLDYNTEYSRYITFPKLKIGVNTKEHFMIEKLLEYLKMPYDPLKREEMLKYLECHHKVETLSGEEKYQYVKKFLEDEKRESDRYDSALAVEYRMTREELDNVKQNNIEKYNQMWYGFRPEYYARMWFDTYA